MQIMVDRGFKKIEIIILAKSCEILRPPSVSNSKQLSKEQVITGRKIAGVRIHVERAIRRIREFLIPFSICLYSTFLDSMC
jgi:hypothetical protein